LKLDMWKFKTRRYCYARHQYIKIKTSNFFFRTWKPTQI